MNKFKSEFLKYKNKILKIILPQKDFAKDIIIVILSIGVLAFLIKNHRPIEPEKGELIPEEIQELLGDYEVEAEYPTIDTADWQNYQTQWYGFELKYPNGWSKPILKSGTAQNNWEYLYQFRKPETEESNLYVGFDVVVYNVKKISELNKTDEFPGIKNQDLKDSGVCLEIDGHLTENESYPAEKIYVDERDECYNPAYFYTLTREDYIYNIIPILSEEKAEAVPSKKEIIQNFPEFISAVSTFNLVKIQRPQIKKIISAPKPAWYKKDSLGRFVCAKKNDKPGKSKQGKDKHLDMECCLDPDEYPNPWCYYPPEKYGKYLK